MNSKEIENIIQLNAFKRYQYFIKKIADYEALWTITYENNDIALGTIDNRRLVSFWSSEDFVKSSLINEWKNCTPVKLSLDYFEETYISLITEHNYLINVFPVHGKSGFVVSLTEFIRDLNAELENYE